MVVAERRVNGADVDQLKTPLRRLATTPRFDSSPLAGAEFLLKVWCEEHLARNPETLKKEQNEQRN